MVLGYRRFFGSNTNIALSAEDAILCDYPLILTDGIHYIEKVYLRNAHPNIESTCYSAKIELKLIKQNENVAV